MQPARQQTLGVILIALLLLIFILVRFARVRHFHPTAPTPGAAGNPRSAH
jgi:hypothetical protein